MFNIGPRFLGTFQLEPATNWFDESFAPILKFHERFARQQRSRPSITYHVTSANSRIDHQLSGINNTVLLYRTFHSKKSQITRLSLSLRLLVLSSSPYCIGKLLDSCFKTRRISKHWLTFIDAGVYPFQTIRGDPVRSSS